MASTRLRKISRSVSPQLRSCSGSEEERYGPYGEEEGEESMKTEETEEGEEYEVEGEDVEEEEEEEEEEDGAQENDGDEGACCDDDDDDVESEYIGAAKTGGSVGTGESQDSTAGQSQSQGAMEKLLRDVARAVR